MIPFINTWASTITLRLLQRILGMIILLPACSNYIPLSKPSLPDQWWHFSLSLAMACGISKTMCSYDALGVTYKCADVFDIFIRIQSHSESWAFDTVNGAATNHEWIKKHEGPSDARPWSWAWYFQLFSNRVSKVRKHSWVGGLLDVTAQDPNVTKALFLRGKAHAGALPID